MVKDCRIVKSVMKSTLFCLKGTILQRVGYRGRFIALQDIGIIKKNVEMKS